MKQKGVFALLLLAVLFFPLLPFPTQVPLLVTKEATSASSSWTSKASTSDEARSPNPYEHLLGSVPTPDVPIPELDPKSQGLGYERLVQPQWHLNETILGANQDDDFSVAIERGFLYSEFLTFTRFGAPSIPTMIWGEDLPPDETLFFYSIGVDEILFVSFNATWFTPTILQGFWLNFWDASNGPVQLTVFGAKYNATSGFNTAPDLNNKISQSLVFDFGPTNKSTEEWVYFDFLPIEPVILDPSRTYGNTFYLAIYGMPSGKCNLNIVDDLVYPDLEDEADVWFAVGGPPLYFQPIDIHLNVSVIRHPYPTEINLQVNSTNVQNVNYYPGTGFLDAGTFPGINCTKTDRFFNVTSTELSLTFDVSWTGWFYERQWPFPIYTAYANETYVDWSIDAFVTYPSRAYDAVLYISIEKGWTIIDVLRDGIGYPDWTRIDFSTISYVQINHADDADWTVLLQSANLVVDVEVLDTMWTPITEANATDWVYVRGYLQNPGGSPVVTGIGNFSAYDPNDVLNWTDWNYINVGYVQFTWDFWWSVQLCEIPSVFTLQVFWSNGTAAGMNQTLLTINPGSQMFVLGGTTEPGSEVIQGSDFQIVVFYCDHAWNGLGNATLSLRNDLTNTTWHPWSYVNLKEAYQNDTWAGYYVIWAHTNESAIDVLHQITLTVFEGLYPAQSYTTNFIIVVAPELIIKFVSGQGTRWDSSAHQWRTSPDPYINQSGVEFTIQVLGRNNTPITDAKLYPILSWLGRSKLLLWEIVPGLPGHYNVSIDMTPIHGISFHVGDIPVIQIFAERFGYKPGASDLLYIHPRARPSYIDVPNPPAALYPNWTYLNPLRVVLRDSLTGQDVHHGTVKAFIPYLNNGENITLVLATPGIGLYEITELDTGGIPPGNHTVTIYAEASDYQSSTITGTLTILEKQTISCQLIEQSYPQQFYGPLYVTIEFSLSNDITQQKSTSASMNNPLPDGTKVTLEARGLAGNLPSDSQYIEDGRATFVVDVNHDDTYTFFVTIDGAEYYWGLDEAPLLDGPGVYHQWTYIHPMTTLISSLPWVAIILFIIIGSVFFFRQRVVLPKRRRRLAKYQVIADTFSDVANLNRLLVLHKESGICVFDPFAEESQDATLVAGFLQAISTFGHDLADSPGLTNGEKGEATALRELQYEGFRILIHDGQFVRNAIVLGGTPSDQLRERLENFTKAFEARYHGDFEHWEGRVDQFNSAADLVEEIFLISLRHPHTVAASKPRGTQLTSLESDIYTLSQELTKDREYVFLGQILSTYLAAGKASKLEALMAIYQLRMKGLFEPIHLAPIVSPDQKAG